MDFSINAGAVIPVLLSDEFKFMTWQVMGLDRTLIVDTLPASEQPDGNSWAARMVAIGSVAGFYMYDALPLNEVVCRGSLQW